LGQGTIFSKLWSRVAEGIGGTLVSNIKERIQSYANRLLKKLVQVAISITILALGLVYVTLGFVKAAATLIPEWASYLLVGTVLILFGFLSAKLAMK